MKLPKGYRKFCFAVAVIMIVTMAACSKSGQEEPGSADKMSGAIEAAKDFINEQRKEEVGALQTSYDEFLEGFEGFKQRNAYIFSEAKRNLVKEVEEAKEQIEQQLITARSAEEEIWQQIKTDVSAAMERLQKAMADFES